MRPLSRLLLLAGCAWFAAHAAGAQEPKAQPKPPDKAPAKGDKAEPVPGRKTRKIEGFTFVFSEDAVTADPSKYERPPLEVLEYECKLLSKMLSPKALDVLRRLVIFVDWDDRVALANGRSGAALASYYSHSPQQIVAEGKHPLQSRGVTIHSLKALTEQRQPKNDARIPCLLLHEFAHAVHDQLFGYDHAGIKAAYEQAMERSLYEKDFYAATNAREFFAEMTCVYLDRLNYYPHTRADLKKHDPVTFKTLEGIWSVAEPATKTAKAPLPHSEKASLDVSLPADVKFGPTLAGPEPVAADLAGKVVLIGYWGAEFTNVLPRLDRLHGELADYGLVVVGAHAYERTPEEIKAAAEKRDVRVAVVRGTFIKDESGKAFKGQPGGRAVLFDHTGKCVYRSSAYDADAAVRAAVGKRLLATAVGSDEVPPAFKSVADAFAAGAGPVAAYPKLGPLTNSSDADTKDRAKKLAELILAPGQKALTGAQASAKSDPVGAFVAAEQVAARFKNTPLAAKATNLTTNLRGDKAVAAELKARTVATQVQQLGNRLRAQEGSFSPGESAFLSKNQAAIEQLKALLEQLRKQYPTARATAEAEKVAREFQIP
ncbi:hypothetical protein [Frigoriglobus tundricola]|uniref:Thioredoxin domain-containing protein n=1 Tax=Frigoriglobus tundricola TaxID=2774151 RepID=A0A6M5YRL6_9BACT|nr:hypothetical protein [Frigoriglobus tundricola]QJW96070.1 hypothetical protein FTUN_3624 [Frigoriglobus tundricola]